MSRTPDQTSKSELRDALHDCLVALGHVGVKFAYDAGGAQDPDAVRFLLQVQASEEGGLHGICERAFMKAQRVLADGK